MSINSDKESKIIPTTSENYFSRSGADIACINCQCGYKDAFETDDTSKPRSLKTQIHSNTTYLKLQEIFNELGIVIDCDGVQDPSLSGNTNFVCYRTRQKMINLIKEYRISFQASHADDLADIG